MDFTQRFSEVCEVLAHEPADNFGISTQVSAWLLMENFHRALLLVSVGDMAAAATLDISITQASDGTGTGAKAITGKAATQLTQAGGDGNDLVMIELRSEELDGNNGFEYIRANLAIAGNSVELAYVVLGLVPRYPPVSTTNVTEVVD
jgi:hypothetical protein